MTENPNQETSENTELTTGIDYGKYAGEGSTFERSDMLVPNLIICQSSTPLCKKSDPKYIDGVSEGMILNTSTERFWDVENKPMRIVPCHFETVFEEQTPRTSSNDRGKYVATHDKDSSVVLGANRENGHLCLADGNVLIKKCVHYVLVMNSDGQDDFEPAVLQLKSSQIKASKKLCSKIAGFFITHNNRKFIPATYDQIYKIQTRIEKNEKGSWFVLDIIPYIVGEGSNPTIWAELVTSKNLHTTGESFRRSVIAGVVTAAEEDGTTEPSIGKDGVLRDEKGQEVF